VMSRSVVPPWGARVAHDGAASTADNNQMLSNEHSDSSVSRTRAYVMPQRDFFHGWQNTSSKQRAVENCHTQAIRDNPVWARWVRRIYYRQICR
jgi:hypothetical protein